jgi:hypothetical protein
VILVVLAYPNGQRENVQLDGIPRVGDHIRLADAEPGANPLVVEAVVWLEKNTVEDHGVLVTVRQRL